jgi:methylenetetrahydrofolate dehydrogenase (NADP+)/methenyltetrahydrofolate cyclohydrolase
MAIQLKGKAITETMIAALAPESERLTASGNQPCLSVLRIGARDDDLAYERSIEKQANALGVRLDRIALEQGVSQQVVLDAICKLNADASVHGVLILRPLPVQIDEDTVRNALSPEKDIDGVTDAAMASILALRRASLPLRLSNGYAPCTAEAVLRILDHYKIELSGKRALVIGRSTVIGKPAAMLLLACNATVSICHTATKALDARCREADILVVAAGLAGAGRKDRLGTAYFSTGQTVVDVGIHADAEGLYGDVNAAAAEQVGVGAVTPVPGGVGGVTTMILLAHTVDAAKRAGTQDLCRAE